MQSHIDHERTSGNVYYKFENDGRATKVPGGYDAKAHELERYRHLYGAGLEAQNARHRESRHHERCRTLEQLYQSKRTAPMETILQVGNTHSEMDPKEQARILWGAACDLVNELRKKYGENIQLLDMSLHTDEQVGHIHLRYTFAAHDKGYMVPNQSKALAEMGYTKPDAAEAKSRYNNPLISFTDATRERFYALCEARGIEIDREVISPSQRHQERQESRCAALQGFIGVLENQAAESLERAMLNEFMRVGRYFNHEGEKCRVLDAYKKFREHKLHELKQQYPEHQDIYSHLENKSTEDIEHDFDDREH